MDLNAPDGRAYRSQSDGPTLTITFSLVGGPTLQSSHIQKCLSFHMEYIRLFWGSVPPLRENLKLYLVVVVVTANLPSLIQNQFHLGLILGLMVCEPLGPQFLPSGPGWVTCTFTLKPIFHGHAKSFASGTFASPNAKDSTFALPNTRNTNMSVSLALGDANVSCFTRRKT